MLAVLSGRAALGRCHRAEGANIAIGAYAHYKASNN
jgi:hypothetical protein